MKGVILAGGKGTRLGILTLQTNKHLVAVYDKQMILYPLEILKKIGINEILVVSGKDHYGKFVEFLGSGKDFGVDFTYKVQDGAGGIAEALYLAKDYFRGEDKIAVVLGDNFFENTPNVDIRKGKKAKVYLKEVNDAHRFGTVNFNKNKEIVSIIEKPQGVTKGYAVTGFYVYPGDVFDFIKTLKPSKRGELEITSVNNYYVGKGLIDYEVLDGFWSDMGTPDSLAATTQWIIQKKLAND